MAPYREGAPPHLDVRPTSPSISTIFIKMGFGFLAMSLVMLLVGILALQGRWGGFGFAEVCVFLVVGGLGTLLCPLLAWWAYGQLHSVVRFSLVGDDVVIEWRRRDVVQRTERVKRRDVVEVAVTDAPSSGGSSYGFVVGLTNGQIDLTTISRSGTQTPQEYLDECGRLARFLGIPARIPS